MPKCVTNAKDPRLHRISVVVLGFLLPKDVSIPKGTLTTQPIPEGVTKVAFSLQHTIGEATSSQPITKEEEEEEEEKEIVDVSDSEDVYEVFNQPLSLETLTSDLGQLPLTQSSHLKEATSSH